MKFSNFDFRFSISGTPPVNSSPMVYGINVCRSALRPTQPKFENRNSKI